MAAARVEIEELETFHKISHKCFMPVSYMCHTAGLKV